MCICIYMCVAQKKIEDGQYSSPRFARNALIEQISLLFIIMLPPNTLDFESGWCVVHSCSKFVGERVTH